MITRSPWHYFGNVHRGRDSAALARIVFCHETSCPICKTFGGRHGTQLEVGSIVRIEKPTNSSGKPTSPHFFIVLTVPEPLKFGDLIPLVGISSRAYAASKSTPGTVTIVSANNRNRSLKSEFIEISAFDQVRLLDHFPGLREFFFIAERGPGLMV
jgi:hypothetical protein